MAGDDVVLLEPVVNDYDALTKVGSVAQGRRLLDRGGYVEWQDAGQTQRWTLPDQTPQAGTPILASVVEADTELHALRGGGPERYVLLADGGGRTLVVLALITRAPGPTYEQVDFDRIWPDGQFDALVARGVQRLQESHHDVRALDNAHPGAVARWRILLFSRASYWTQVVVLVTALLALAARVLIG
jgi:hypothetical protein